MQFKKLENYLISNFLNGKLVFDKKLITPEIKYNI